MLEIKIINQDWKKTEVIEIIRYKKDSGIYV